jgi:hypothetical protein
MKAKTERPSNLLFKQEINELAEKQFNAQYITIRWLLFWCSMLKDVFYKVALC